MVKAIICSSFQFSKARKEKKMEPGERIIVALDVDNPKEAINLVKELGPLVGAFKIGLQLINGMFASLIAIRDLTEAIRALGEIRILFNLLNGKIFWDGKFNDIPNTIAGASKEIAKMKIKMFDVHASAGRETIAEAVANKGDSLVFGVTVLTSIGEQECVSIFGTNPSDKVLQFAEMLLEEGADGIICSPQELIILREGRIPADLIRVTPGIRPEWAQRNDQKRIMTPAEAIKYGADYLVIGRPITQPPPEIGFPRKAVELIAEEIVNAQKGERDVVEYSRH